MSRTKTQKKQEEKPVVKVRCCDCRHFSLDTEGLSFSAVTGEYFMGVCTKGLTPDTPKKQFADKARVCNQYQNK